jgi:hypothetical protein
MNMTTIGGLRDRLAEQIKRGELAAAAGQVRQAARYESLAAETTAELARLGFPQARASAWQIAGYGNPSRLS